MSEYGAKRDWINNDPLTVVNMDFLHFCLEYRWLKYAGRNYKISVELNMTYQ